MMREVDRRLINELRFGQRYCGPQHSPAQCDIALDGSGALASPCLARLFIRIDVAGLWWLIMRKRLGKPRQIEARVTRY